MTTIVLRGLQHAAPSDIAGEHLPSGASGDDYNDNDDDDGDDNDDNDCTPWAPSCSPLGYCR